MLCILTTYVLGLLSESIQLCMSFHLWIVSSSFLWIMLFCIYTFLWNWHVHFAFVCTHVTWVEPYCFSWNRQCMSEQHYAPVMSSITCLSMYCSFLISYLFGFTQKGYAIHQWHNNRWFSHRQAFFSPTAIECFFFSSLLSCMNAYAKPGLLLTYTCLTKTFGPAPSRQGAILI